MANNNDLVNFIVDKYSEAMDGACQIFMQQVQEQIVAQLINSGIHGNGKLARWGQNVAKSVKPKPVVFSNNTITCSIQVPTDAGTDGNIYVQAQVLAQGNKENGWNPPHTKPGQKTWNGDIDQYKQHVPPDVPSKLMPKSFSHDNYIDKNFMNNAGKKSQAKLDNHFGAVSSVVLKHIKAMMQSAGR